MLGEGRLKKKQTFIAVKCHADHHVPRERHGQLLEVRIAVALDERDNPRTDQAFHQLVNLDALEVLVKLSHEKQSFLTKFNGLISG